MYIERLFSSLGEIYEIAVGKEEGKLEAVQAYWEY